MKSSWLTLGIVCALSLSSYSQDNSEEIKVKKEKSTEMESLFSTKQTFGAYFGFNSKYTKINNQEALLLGGEWNMVVSHSLNLGFQGFGLVNPVTSNAQFADSSTSSLSMGYGGVNIEPVILSRKVVHMSFPVFLGFGGVAERSSKDFDESLNSSTYKEGNTIASDFILVAEPGAQVELNVFKWMRLGVGASYRFTGGVELPNFSSKELDGFSANMNLRLGWF